MNFFESYGNKIRVELNYPRLPDNQDIIEIDLMDTRSADGIQVSYDFHRDGWVIKQSSIFEWDINDKDMDEDWQEVTFIPAWGRYNKREDLYPRRSRR